MKLAIVSADLLANVSARAGKRLSFMEPIFLQFGGNGLLAHGWLTTVLPHFSGWAKQLNWGAYHDSQDALQKDLEKLRLDYGKITFRVNRALQLLTEQAEGRVLPTQKEDMRGQ